MPYRGGQVGELSGGPLQRARLALSNNQPAVAEEICRRRLEKKPDETPTRLILAQALIQMQRHRDAVIEARRVLRDQPNSVDGLLVLATALMGTNQINPPKEAVEAAERAVQLQPKSARTHVQLAEVLMMRKEFKQALTEADEAVRLEPRNASAYLIKGMSLYNSKDYTGAEEAFRAAIRQDRTMAQAHMALAQALADQKRIDEAMEAVDTAQKLNPLLPASQILQLRAQIYRKQRKYGKAYNLFLDQVYTSTGKKTFWAPLQAGVAFLLSFFGQNAPYALMFIAIFLVLLIFFGVGKIPVVGGGINDVLAIALTGVLAWFGFNMSMGMSILQRLRDGRAALFGVGAFVLGIVVIFLLARLFGGFTTPKGHAIAWFNSFSFGLAIVAGLVAGVLALANPPSFGRRA
jgi:tetratricopeptide (TPR) repeat protein